MKETTPSDSQKGVEKTDNEIIAEFMGFTFPNLMGLAYARGRKNR